MIKINKNIIINYNRPPLIIAEISGNHGGEKKRFFKLIDSAFSNGADLVKIQTYEPQDITIKKKDNKYKIKKGIWKNKYLWDLYKKACTPFSWHKTAFNIAKKHNKILFSTPFSFRAVDLLEKFNVPIYKIASFEITDLNLIDYIASKKKPIIISTGMSEFEEIKRAIRIINKYHKKIIILNCVSNYPTKLEDTNLNNIEKLKRVFPNYMIGISDHTNDIHSSIAAIPLKVVAIEKHFKLNNKKTPDSDFSITPKKLQDLKNLTFKIFESLNFTKNRMLKKNIRFRRSIFAKKDIQKNEKLSRNNIVSYRPIIGIKAENFFKICGKRVRKKILKNDPIFFKDIL